VHVPIATAAPPVTVPPSPVTAPPPVVAPPVGTGAVEKADEDGTAEATEATEAAGKVEEETDSTGKTKTTRVASAGGSENRKLLADAQRMLRAERFAEARGLFEKLAKSKRERGQALVGLAEISFQEKRYADAARAAELAADRGGGVKAHVLLGDAHFRLARYKEAARAYESALRIDPKNASAKSGLALANKRM
jgi:tetratricopeptide (TPR) repeat protein